MSRKKVRAWEKVELPKQARLCVKFVCFEDLTAEEAAEAKSFLSAHGVDEDEIKCMDVIKGDDPAYQQISKTVEAGIDYCPDCVKLDKTIQNLLRELAQAKQMGEKSERES